jgi:hypothetical protein
LALQGVPSATFRLEKDEERVLAPLGATTAPRERHASAVASVAALAAEAGGRAAQLTRLADQLATPGDGALGSVALAFGIALQQRLRLHARCIASLSDAVALRQWQLGCTDSNRASFLAAWTHARALVSEQGFLASLCTHRLGWRASQQRGERVKGNASAPLTPTGPALLDALFAELCEAQLAAFSPTRALLWQLFVAACEPWLAWVRRAIFTADETHSCEFTRCEHERPPVCVAPAFAASLEDAIDDCVGGLRLLRGAAPSSRTSPAAAAIWDAIEEPQRIAIAAASVEGLESARRYSAQQIQRGRQRLRAIQRQYDAAGERKRLELALLQEQLSEMLRSQEEKVRQLEHAALEETRSVQRTWRAALAKQLADKAEAARAEATAAAAEAMRARAQAEREAELLEKGRRAILQKYGAIDAKLEHRVRRAEWRHRRRVLSPQRAALLQGRVERASAAPASPATSPRAAETSACAPATPIATAAAGSWADGRADATEPGAASEADVSDGAAEAEITGASSGATEGARVTEDLDAADDIAAAIADDDVAEQAAMLACFVAAASASLDAETQASLAETAATDAADAAAAAGSLAAQAMVEALEATAAADGGIASEPSAETDTADLHTVLSAGAGVGVGAGDGVQPPASTIVDVCIVQPVLQRTRLVGEACALYLRHECRLQEALSAFRLFFLGAWPRFDPVRPPRLPRSSFLSFSRCALRLLRPAHRPASRSFARRHSPPAAPPHAHSSN